MTVLKETEDGAQTVALNRKHGVSSARFYAWKSRFGGIEVNDIAKMRRLEDKTGRLKLLAARFGVQDPATFRSH